MDLYRSGRMLKHVGVCNGRRIIALMPDQNDLDYVFIIEAERLPHSLEEIIVREVENSNAQTRIWFSYHLHGLEYDGVNMIRFLFNTPAAISRVNYREVLMVPVPSQSVKLSDVYDDMLKNTPDLANVYHQWKATKAVSVATGDVPQQPTQQQPATPAFAIGTHNEAVDQVEANQAIARNLMFQYQMLKAEAEAKLEEAYKYDPSLRKEPDVVVVSAAPAPSEPEKAQVWVDSSTGREYRTEAALKAAISRRENAKIKNY